MKIWWRRIGAGLAAAGSLAFVGYVASTLEFTDLVPHLTLRGLGVLLCSILLYSLIVPLAALAWQLLLSELGSEMRWSPLNTTLLATQAGKYLPGNVAQHFGRVGLSLSLGIPSAVLLASMAYEFVLLLIADVFTAVIASALSTPGMTLIGGKPGLALAGVVAGSILGLGGVSIIGKLLPRLFRRLMPKARLTHDELPALRPQAIARVIGIYVTAMVCVGASISVLALGLLKTGTVDFALLTAAFTIAWAVGFVTPGAPAGIGVREALLLVMLGPPLGAESASLLILALRVATTLGDLLCFAIGVVLLARGRRLGRAELRGQS